MEAALEGGVAEKSYTEGHRGHREHRKGEENKLF
jgi:hypothetical protein